MLKGSKIHYNEILENLKERPTEEQERGGRRQITVTKGPEKNQQGRDKRHDNDEWPREEQTGEEEETDYSDGMDVRAKEETESSNSSKETQE